MEHSKEFVELAEDARRQITEVSVPETIKRMQEGATLIDVREDNEWEEGHARGAIHIGRGVIERDIIDKIPDKNTELILYCGGGFRSALSALNLQKMGYRNVKSMAGGWREWNEQNGPTE